MSGRTVDFQTIRSEGGLLPPDLLRRVLDPKEKLDGTRPEDYGLLQSERLSEVITQSWNRLGKYWTEFRDAAANLHEGEAGTGLTNEKWSLPLLRELGFGLLPTSAGPEINGRTYAINRFFGPVPVHLVGCGVSLDRRAAGVRWAAAVNPHGLVQELLNRSPGHLWAIVSNGLRLRVLRDNQALSRQSFLEFDLDAIFAGEVYSDFVLLWLMAHATRFAPREAERPETCWLEHWTKLANEQGTRALGDLRGGVEKALQILGEGFTSHPKNIVLRDALRTGAVSLADFHGQLQRVVYRLIFLFVAEDRTIDGQSLLHRRDDSDAARTARERFAVHYSTARLRELAGKIKGSRHGDLWRQFQLLVGALSGDTAYAAAREHLALPVLGSFLWDPVSTGVLNATELTNHDFLEALRHLAFTRQGKVLRPVDYKNLGAEELGGVYESLLALTPQISADGAHFTFAELAGNQRKTSGSYYTPDSPVQCLLDSALDPVVEEAMKGKSGVEAEQAILSLKVCDPAVGSGHFLVGAAHRLARHLARLRALPQGESEPSPLLYQHALRDVIGRCLYGVDVNPMAAELCRVSLWLEALEPGKPLSFLDHHIRVGNSLLGATPELIAAGLPDDAFKPIEGDEKTMCSALRRRNKQERDGQRDMLHLMVAEPVAEYNSIAERTRQINDAPDDTLDQVRAKAEQFRKLVVSTEYEHAQFIADTWCAAFVWHKHPDTPAEPLTTDTISRLESDPNALLPAQRAEVERLLRQYQFFHWHLAFPEVFAKGGFDCVLGNPPWEASDLMKVEFFAALLPGVAAARTTDDRITIIERAVADDTRLEVAWKTAQRENSAQSHFIRSSHRYPLTSGGKLNTYRTFAELSTCLLSKSGRMGMILKSGIINAQDNQKFFASLLRDSRVVAALDFINTRQIFADVVANERFCLLTVTGVNGGAKNASFMFCLEEIEQISNQNRKIIFKTDELRALTQMI
jgi:Eco57I restriction-modification methylase